MGFEFKYKHLIEKEDYFHFHHGANITSGDVREFSLHHHPYCEIYIYISGRARFFINGTVFHLNPYDVIIIPPYTLHQPRPEVGDFFERYVLNVYPEFFQHMDCSEYQNLFGRLAGLNYKIPGHVVKRSKILDFVTFFNEKYKENDPAIAPLVSCQVVELLYHLNTIDKFEKCDSVNKITQDIITYVDVNFASILSVDDVSENFFYSKNHLSHIFKKNTGLTIIQYVNIKKIENVEKLHKQGKSLISACIESGFSNYESFAYNYKKEFGIPPKKGISSSM